ncbi:MAG: mechanosensitive ion channel family protein [Bacteroidota bacterium]|jgi:small-conductance mechanosensitive channel
MNFLEFALGDTRLSVLLSTLLFIVAGYVAGRILKLGLRLFSSKITKNTRSSLDDLIVTTFAQHVTGLLTLLVAMWSVKWAAGTIDDSLVFLTNGLSVLVEILYVLTVLFICFFVTRLIDAVVRWYLHEVATRTLTHLDDELAPLANRVLKILIYLVGMIIILDHFHQNISTFVVSLGIGSLAIALAAQETLANMIAGFVLMIDRPFRINDRIRLPDGTIGVVREIGIRSTRVIDDYQVMIITPNAEIVKSQIKNFSYPNDIVRFEVPFGVAYGTDLVELRRIILERLSQETDIIEPETSEVRITEMADSSMHAKLMCKIRNPNLIPRRQSDLLLIIYDTLYENNIEIPYPQRVLHLSSETRAALGNQEDGEE